MDCNSYSYAPYMLDGKPEKSQNIEKCAWCKHLGECTGYLKDCQEIKSMDTKIKAWYQENYPTDELGNDLNQKATFWDLFYQLDARQCVHKLMGVGDSIVRERLFVHLAGLMDVSYDYVYEQWLLGA